MKIHLFTTSGCHLCEQALEMLLLARDRGHRLEICEVEISESESLMEQYGIRIPVVMLEGTTAELGWPFDDNQLEHYLQEGS